ncbi:aspartate ammonia-lyase [Apilactobacillus apinorum]|uniref:aspartate ammonia-lyase n=1 Tax=Apilactobacillus apinorum TaxID=1218495 RepID=UPI0006B54DEE|nr:aspartate ammonia-lyase [Apilactobacillus apinorum]KOY69982.1 putative aspartate ammonia-lyase [Apilactobacillus apinorum]CAI2603881.1 Putative aspartate ammonia-lyase [Apilactobacillus apinorum]
MRLEEDCVGKLEVEDDALYGIHSLRAATNFPITKEKVDPLVIESYIQLKKASVTANYDANAIDVIKHNIIVEACDYLLEHHHLESFITPAIQGGAGTSTNMNVNEVIANVAMRLHPEIKIHPNDDVNQAQSTNDTYPTAGKMAMLKRLPKLTGEINRLIETLDGLAKQFKFTIKLGRTQLQDAVPTTFGKSFHAYASLFRRDLKRINQASEELKSISMGGTAIGTGTNTTKYYREHIVDEINKITNMGLKQDTDLIDAIQNTDHFVAFSSSLKTLAVDLSKFSNDLRLLGSGPQSGLNELLLPKRQAGSSIMPNKVNPVIPEVVNQVAFEVIGFDATVTAASEAGQLELNAFEPIMFKSILTAEIHLANAITTLVDNCLVGIDVNVDQCLDDVRKSAVTATVLSPILGYNKTTELIKRATKEHDTVPHLLIQNNILSADKVKQLFSPEYLVNGNE